MKVDKMTMTHSVEAMVPYLDHRLVEYLISLPLYFEIRRLTNKYVPRKAMTVLLPPEIVWCKKHGLMVPLTQWLRGELQNLLSRCLLTQRAMLDVFTPRKRLKNFFGREGVD